MWITYSDSEVANFHPVCETALGNPHILYMKKNKDGTVPIYVDIWQVSGVSDSGVLPNWRQFKFNQITYVRFCSIYTIQVLRDLRQCSNLMPKKMSRILKFFPVRYNI